MGKDAIRFSGMLLGVCFDSRSREIMCWHSADYRGRLNQTPHEGPMFDQFSKLFLPEDRLKPEALWNSLDISARRQILADEGFEQAHIRRICSTKWRHLSEVERIWLFSPLLLASMDAYQEPVQISDELNLRLSRLWNKFLRAGVE
jgi:hypothetical protein